MIRIIGRLVRPAFGSIADNGRHVVAPFARDTLAREIGKFTVSLDRHQLSTEMAHYSGCIARSGPYLECAVVRLQRPCLEHKRHDVGLRNCLPRLNRKRAIVVGELGESSSQKRFAVDGAHCCEHAGIGYTSASELVRDHPFASLNVVEHGCFALRFGHCWQSRHQTGATALQLALVCHDPRNSGGPACPEGTIDRCAPYP